MRKFFVLEEEVCKICEGAGVIDNPEYAAAIERLKSRTPPISFKTVEAMYGPEILECPNGCELGMVYKRVPLREALIEDNNDR